MITRYYRVATRLVDDASSFYESILGGPQEKGCKCYPLLSTSLRGRGLAHATSVLIAPYKDPFFHYGRIMEHRTA